MIRVKTLLYTAALVLDHPSIGLPEPSITMPSDRWVIAPQSKGFDRGKPDLLEQEAAHLIGYPLTPRSYFEAVGLLQSTGANLLSAVPFYLRVTDS